MFEIENGFVFAVDINWLFYLFDGWKINMFTHIEMASAYSYETLLNKDFVS